MTARLWLLRRPDGRALARVERLAPWTATPWRAEVHAGGASKRFQHVSQAKRWAARKVGRRAFKSAKWQHTTLTREIQRQWPRPL